ncbi:P-protein [anaerobic digester metagenome]
MTLFTLGPEGTFSHEVAARLDPDVRLCPTIASVFAGVAAAEGDGIVPLENSEAGSVGPTLEGLTRHPVVITGECTIPICHQLAVADPSRPIDRLYAHPQTVEQCSLRVEALGLPIIPTSSNAASAIAARDNPGTGALVSVGLADRHGLVILEREVQNSSTNQTRFVRISLEAVPATPPCRASLLLDPEGDRAGLLAALLAPFAVRGLNLTRIESRPSRRGMGRYVFFIDGDWAPGWDEAVEEVSRISRVKNLGRYRPLELP